MISPTTITSRIRSDIDALERMKATREANQEQGSIRGIENDLRRLRAQLAVAQGRTH